MAPFPGRPLNASTQGVQDPRGIARSKSHEAPCEFQAAIEPYGSNFSRSDDRIAYNDPAQVRQWAASSATGVGSWMNSQIDSQFGIVPDNMNIDCVTRSSQATSPFVFQAGHQGNFMGLHYPGANIETDYSHYQGPNCNLDSFEGLFYTDSIPADIDTQLGASVEDMFADPTVQGSGFSPDWTCHGGDGWLAGSTSCAPQPISLSPSSGYEASSPSFSRQSAVDTPVSMAVPEDFVWSAENVGHLGNGNLAPLDMAEALQLPPALSTSDESSVTLMQSQVPQGLHPASHDMWQQNVVHQDTQYGSPASSNKSRRTSAGLHDGRIHLFYNRERDNDGNFHCPVDPDCEFSHKLKCVYHKHLDGHLKPFRCRVKECEGIPFSSTACQLRHEREAHGFHGHGDRPYLCFFTECDRHIKGFPRRFNLHDHMKRCHNYIVSDGSNSSNSPSPPSSTSCQSTEAKGPARKKRSTDSSQAGAVKKPRDSTSTKSTSKARKSQANTPVKPVESRLEEWKVQKAHIDAMWRNLDPSDVNAYERWQADSAALHQLAQVIRTEDSSQR